MYVVPPTVWGVGALTVLVEPSMTVRVNVVVELELPTSQSASRAVSLEGEDHCPRPRRTVAVFVRPPESVRSGSARDTTDNVRDRARRTIPPATPLKPCSVCE